MTTENTPPEVNEAPADPTLVGTLSDQENNALGILRRQGQNIQMQIGEVEIRKSRMLQAMADLEIQAQRVLTEAGKRLGIQEGTPWTVTPDGSVRLIPDGAAFGG